VGCEDERACRGPQGVSDHVVAVSFSPDGKHLASGSYDGSVILWDAASREVIRKFEAKAGKVYSVAFSPDGKVLASGHDQGDIKLWDVASGRLLQSLKEDAFSVYSLIFTPNGRLLAARSGFAINLWDLAKGNMVRSLKGAGSAAISFSSMAMSPDGTEIVSGDGDGSIRVWDVAEGKQIQEIEAHIKNVSAVAYSPDGKTLASAGGDKTVKLCNLGSIKAAGRRTGRLKLGTLNESDRPRLHRLQLRDGRRAWSGRHERRDGLCQA
jgi:WD40 repeat protein